jgi:hypothetical protein
MWSSSEHRRQLPKLCGGAHHSPFRGACGARATDTGQPSIVTRAPSRTHCYNHVLDWSPSMRVGQGPSRHRESWKVVAIRMSRRPLSKSVWTEYYNGRVRLRIKCAMAHLRRRDHGMRQESPGGSRGTCSAPRTHHQHWAALWRVPLGMNGSAGRPRLTLQRCPASRFWVRRNSHASSGYHGSPLHPLQIETANWCLEAESGGFASNRPSRSRPPDSGYFRGCLHVFGA